MISGNGMYVFGPTEKKTLIFHISTISKVPRQQPHSRCLIDRMSSAVCIVPKKKVRFCSGAPTDVEGQNKSSAIFVGDFWAV